MENLHSEEEYGHVKYVHNYTKTVHVQYPVDLDDLVEEAEEFWLTTDEFDLLLKLPDSANPPTGVHYNCTWGDGNSIINMEFDEGSNRETTNGHYQYHNKHNYASAGEYTVTCVLFNKVSFKEFTKNVIYYHTTPVSKMTNILILDHCV